MNYFTNREEVFQAKVNVIVQYTVKTRKKKKKLICKRDCDLIRSVFGLRIVKGNKDTEITIQNFKEQKNSFPNFSFFLS